MLLQSRQKMEFNVLDSQNLLPEVLFDPVYSVTTCYTFHPLSSLVLLSRISSPALSTSCYANIIQRPAKRCADIVKLRPGRVRQNRYAKAGIIFPQPRTSLLADLCRWKSCIFIPSRIMNDRSLSHFPIYQRSNQRRGRAIDAGRSHRYSIHADSMYHKKQSTTEFNFLYRKRSHPPCQGILGLRSGRPLIPLSLSGMCTEHEVYYAK